MFIATTLLFFSLCLLSTKKKKIDLLQWNNYFSFPCFFALLLLENKVRRHWKQIRKKQKFMFNLWPVKRRKIIRGIKFNCYRLEYLSFSFFHHYFFQKLMEQMWIVTWVNSETKEQNGTVCETCFTMWFQSFNQLLGSIPSPPATCLNHLHPRFIVFFNE